MNLEQEIQGYKMQAQKQRRVIFEILFYLTFHKGIYELEKQREQYVAEANESTRKYLQAMEEVKLREMNIMELQKKIAESDSKLKQQQVTYLLHILSNLF